MTGQFSDEALELYNLLLNSGESLDFSESGTYDFTRCVRPDGSSYGTGGTCRLGSKAGAKEKEVKEPKKRKSAARISPRQAAGALEGRSMARGARFKDEDFDPGVVGKRQAAKNIERAKEADEAISPEDAKKRVSKAVSLLQDRVKKLREAELDPEMRQNPARIGRLQDRQNELKAMIKHLKSGNAALASQAVLEKNIR